MDRAEAEAQHLEYVGEGWVLDPRVPRDKASVSLQRTLCSDVRLFIEQGWLDHAIQKGWSILDLFGVDRVSPFARYDPWGSL
jgi:hypothetical protein